MMTIQHDSGHGLERHYCVKDAANLAGISREWFYQLLRRGDVQAEHTWSGRRWVPQSEIDRIRRTRGAA